MNFYSDLVFSQSVRPPLSKQFFYIVYLIAANIGQAT